MSQVHIEIGKLEDNLTEIFYYPTRVEDEITFTLETVFFGRFVKIWLEKTEHLTICEVEIYCNEGLFLYDKHSPHHTSHKLGSFGQTPSTGQLGQYRQNSAKLHVQFGKFQYRKRDQYQ